MRYWISYDLGLRGNYDQLYAWLDQNNARECGDSVATFLSGKTREQVAKELSKIVDLDRHPRISHHHHETWWEVRNWQKKARTVDRIRSSAGERRRSG